MPPPLNGIPEASAVNMRDSLSLNTSSRNSLAPEIINGSFRFVQNDSPRYEHRRLQTVCLQCTCFFFSLKCKCTHLPNEIYGQNGLICLKYLYYHVFVRLVPNECDVSKEKKGRDEQKKKSSRININI